MLGSENVRKMGIYRDTLQGTITYPPQNMGMFESMIFRTSLLVADMLIHSLEDNLCPEKSTIHVGKYTNLHGSSGYL